MNWLIKLYIPVAALCVGQHEISSGLPVFKFKKK